jgi:hypothetical protein
MGAVDFFEEGYGSDARKVFQRKAAELRRMHGNDAYAGHMGLKDDFKMHTTRVLTKNEAYRMAESAIDNYSKWGPAGAIAFGKEKVVASNEFEVTVKARDEREAKKLVEDKVRKARKRQGVEIEVKFSEVKQTAPAGKRKLTKTKSDTGGYFTWRTSRGARHHKEYPTLREATQALTAYLSDPNNRRAAAGEEHILYKTQDLGSISYQESSKLPTYTVKGVRKQIKVGKVEGYLFFGLAPN